MSIGGRVNPEIGCAYNYFSCLGKPLAETMSENSDFLSVLTTTPDA